MWESLHLFFSSESSLPRVQDDCLLALDGPLYHILYAKFTSVGAGHTKHLVFQNLSKIKSHQIYIYIAHLKHPVFETLINQKNSRQQLSDMSIYLKNHIDDVYEYVFNNFKQTVNQLVIKILNGDINTD